MPSKVSNVERARRMAQSMRDKAAKLNAKADRLVEREEWIEVTRGHQRPVGLDRGRARRRTVGPG